ncbi:MAG: RNA recognition motif domain-containing protein [Chthoniobacterales bacterium]
MQQRHSSSGSRRPRGGRSRSSSHPRSSDTYPVTREPRKPAGLWDKVKALFGLTPKPSAPSTNGHRQPREDRPRRDDARETREPREARAPRERTPREVRKPEAVEVTTPRLYVGNLSYDAAESDLHELFSGVGTVAHVEVIANKHTQRSKGFGFVQMNGIAEAKRAVDELHDKEYMGRKLVVSGAKLPPDRSIGRDSEEGSSRDEADEDTSALQA